MMVNISKIEVHINWAGFEKNQGEIEACMERLRTVTEEVKASPDVQALYDRVKTSVQKLYDGLTDEKKREAVQYVLSLFTIAEQDATSAKTGPKSGSTKTPSERMKQAWVTRKERKAERRESETTQAADREQGFGLPHSALEGAEEVRGEPS